MTIYNCTTNWDAITIGATVTPIAPGSQLHFSGLVIQGVSDELVSGEANLIVSNGVTYVERSQGATHAFLGGFGFGLPLCVILILIMVTKRGLNPSVDRI